jgi:hypothetical protein
MGHGILYISCNAHGGSSLEDWEADVYERILPSLTENLRRRVDT